MSDLEIPKAVAISDYAIIVGANDNVAVVKNETFAGLEVILADDTIVKLRDAVPPGHRFATRDIPAGQFVTQFGQPIGTSLGIISGEQVTHANMSNDVPVVRDLPEDLHSAPPDYVPEAERRTFIGYRRANGRVGTRNFLLIVPTSMCASHEAQQIAMMAEFSIYKRDRFPNVDGVVAIPHSRGCGCAGRLEYPGDAAHAVQLRRTPERRGRHLHRAGLREDQPDRGRALPAARESRSRQAGGALRHPGDGRNAVGHRARFAGGRRRCCPTVNEAARARRLL